MPQRESRPATPEPLPSEEEFRHLRDEVRVLRDAMDELREQLEHTLRNGPSNQDAWLPIRPITSFPLDPTAPDWAVRVNAITPYGTPQAMPNTAEATPESEPYCCPQPRLVWLGDADSPGIECANCGYLVAQSGEIAIWRESPPDTSDEPSMPTDIRQQKSLFETD